MKKTLVIILLSIQVIGLGGYRLFFHYFEKQASVQIVERLDGGGFSENELIEVKIPYPLPYAANRGEYERYDGEVEMNGVHYNYVKRKMLNDTLYLLCIPNTAKNELYSAKTDLIAGLSDVKHDGKTQQKSVELTVKPFTTEYNQTFSEISFSLSADTKAIHFPAGESRLPVAGRNTPFQPPRA